ncbi:MAG: tRNA1(Val) (adenine(37)-N6)-methyltransferase [Alphaproteobacteria bacterium]
MSAPVSAETEVGAVTEDRLLGGRVRLLQPRAGYRAAIDPVLLAAAVAARPGASVLDAGCGTGAAALCLAARLSDCRITGIELQPGLAALARHSVTLNGWDARISVLDGDIADPPPELAPGGFDWVMANPPYLNPGGGDAPTVPARARAHVESAETGLAAWVAFSLAMARRKGRVVFIHRADRLDELVAALRGPAGDIAILPLWPAAGRAAKRVIVTARKGVRGPTRLLPGLVLHRADGGYTPEADAILSGGAGLRLEDADPPM